MPKKPKNPRFNDLEGLRFSNWLVISYAGRAASGNTMWNVICDCGTKRAVSAGSLKSNRSKNCGCERPKRMTRPPEYGSWRHMLYRCNSPQSKDYIHYGGRGISVCDRWKSFEMFLADMGPRPSSGHSIDRIDNNGNYEPKNCRWATHEIQQRNRTNNVMLTHNGITQCLSAWAEEYGITNTMLNQRLKRGWDTEKALTEPPRIRPNLPKTYNKRVSE